MENKSGSFLISLNKIVLAKDYNIKNAEVIKLIGILAKSGWSLEVSELKLDSPQRRVNVILGSD